MKLVERKTLGVPGSEEWDSVVDSMNDDDLHYIAQAYNPWGSSSRLNDNRIKDEDGFDVSISMDDLENYSKIQKICWEKFNKNPQISSHVRDFMGNLTGFNFETSSDVQEIQECIDEISTDIRNELQKQMSKFVARSEIEGELFLCLTLHDDGFVEIDFMDPSALKGGGSNNSGIYFHPSKGTMPVFYNFQITDPVTRMTSTSLIPSIYVAHIPSIATDTISAYKLDSSLFARSTNKNSKYKSIGNYKRFIIAWDRGYFTKRNVSHIRTTIEWVNHYENLKKWEIDHKRSSGAYLWVVTMVDAKAFRTWLKMSDEQKASTGLAAKKTPGGTLILPPGVKLECINPTLGSISDQDTDILSMVSSGLNKPEDMMTGQTKGSTFSGIKASRGPQADRIQDQIAYFERFLRYDFWRSIFFLRSAVSSFKLDYKVKEGTDFKNQKPVFKTVKKKAWELVHFDFPQSAISNLEDRAKAYLGVQHPSVVEGLGIPREEVAKKLGFGSYRKRRLQYSTEEEVYPELPTTVELKALQGGMQSPNTTIPTKTTPNPKDDKTKDRTDKGSDEQKGDTTDKE